MDYKVLTFDIESRIDVLNLEARLAEGWTVFRCDSLHPGGNSYTKGHLVYVLQRPKCES